MVLIISIDGNIGSGKSTALKFLKDKNKNNNNIIFLQEPIDIWNEIKYEGKTILEKFYENQEKYAFPFQMMAFITRYNILLNTIKKNPDAIIITERSLYTDKYVFAKMLFESTQMNNFEYQIYNKWFDTFIQNLPEHKYIYFYSSPSVCYDRIAKRSRVGEDLISLSYLENCNVYHDDMFKELEPSLKINLDEYDLNENTYDDMINIIEDFIFEEKENDYDKPKLTLLQNFFVGFISIIMMLLFLIFTHCISYLLVFNTVQLIA